MGQEFASNGYVVFLLDHHDGSSVYTTLRDGSAKVFEKGQVTPDKAFKIQNEETEKAKKFWYEKIEVRTREVRALIDEVCREGVMQKVLGDKNIKPKLDLDKLIVAGHSMGGATALSAGDVDARIKAVLVHDPWGRIIEPKIQNFGPLLQKPVQMTNTLWHAMMYLGKDPLGQHFEKRIEKKEAYECLIVDKTDHFYQCDTSTICPFDIELVITLSYYLQGLLHLKSDFLIPSTRKAGINQYFYALWLKYLQK